MINFTVGPVQSEDYVCAVGGEQVPYFRTPEFSQIMLENESLMKKFTKAPEGSRVVFLTGSGTAGMEATVMNMFTKQDKLLVINGGSFGARFVEICEIHEIPHAVIKLEAGCDIKKEMLDSYEGKGFTGLLVNIHETSTGVRYNMDLLSAFCQRNNMYFVVDAISSFIADDIHMENSAIDIMITGSQKALAVAPGIAVVVMSSRAVERINSNTVKSLYFDLKAALKDGERGQTPFTPAVGILRQINARLKQIDKDGGIEAETAKVAGLATYFREAIKELPFEIVSESMSNAVTPLSPIHEGVSAFQIFTTLKDEYNIWVCPNGGAMADKIFRVGHIGALTKSDYDQLLDALKDMEKRGLL